jgi:hypothetical protein
MESSKLRGGVFTYYLVRGLSGEASLRKDGSIRPSELGLFFVKQVHSPMLTERQYTVGQLGL